MITCTSDMSGRASSGMLLSDQIPASTTTRVPEKTRKRLFAHHSMIREIMSHTSCGIDGQLLAKNGAPVLLSGHGDLPGACGAKIHAALIQTVALVGTLDGRLHGAHPHCRHGWHVESDGDLRPGDRCSVNAGQSYANDIAAFARREWFGGKFRADSCNLHGCSAARSGWRRDECSGGGLQLAL